MKDRARASGGQGARRQQLCPPLGVLHCLELIEIMVHRENICEGMTSVKCSSGQSLSCVRLFVTPWTAAHQASLSITKSQSLLKLMSIESVMPSKHLILCHQLLLLLLSFPASRSFQMSWFFTLGGQSIAISASASVLPMNIQD